MKVSIPIPLKKALPIRPNERGHSRYSAGTTRKHRRMGELAILGQPFMPGLPVVVTLTRVSRGAPDDDNVVGAFKAFRDGVADAFGVRDNHPDITWRYASAKGAPAIVVDVEDRA